MLEIARDPVWQFVGAILALGGIAIPLMTHFLGRQRKELARGTISISNLVTVSEKVANRVAFTFDGKPVADVKLVVFGVKNSGDQPIQASEFMSPISLTFGSAAVVLTAEVGKRSPENLCADVAVHANSIQIQPLLLNSGDYLVVQILLSAPSAEIAFDTRIVGVSRFEDLNSGRRVEPNTAKKFFLLVVSVLMMGVSLISFIAPVPLDGTAPLHIREPLAAYTPAIAAAGIFALSMLLSIFWDWLAGRYKNHSRRYIDDSV